MAEINDVTVRIKVDDSELQEKRELKIEVDDKELQDLRKLAEITGKDLQDLIAIKDKTRLEPMGLLAFAGLQNQSMFRSLSSERILSGIDHIGKIVLAFELGKLTGELIKIIIREIEANRSVIKDDALPTVVDALRQPSSNEPISFQEIAKQREEQLKQQLTQLLEFNPEKIIAEQIKQRELDIQIRMGEVV